MDTFFLQSGVNQDLTLLTILGTVTHVNNFCDHKAKTHTPSPLHLYDITNMTPKCTTPLCITCGQTGVSQKCLTL